MRYAVPVFLSLLVAGCSGSSADFIASASDPWILPKGTYDYAAARTIRGQGSAEVELDDRNNDGKAVAEVQHGADEVRLEMVRFEGAQASQGGGVARDVTVHGASGNGSGELPEFFAYAAAWGRARVQVNGRAELDPTTANEEFPARVYVVRGHVRDATDGVVYTANRDAAYSPARPEDGSVSPEGGQVLYEVRTGTGELWRHYAFNEVRITRL